MRKALLFSTLAFLFAACGSEPDTVWIRLIDDFEPSMVQDSPPAVEPERTEWRFDGEGTIEHPRVEGQPPGPVRRHRLLLFPAPPRRRRDTGLCVIC